MKKIAILSGKGGVGKSTISINIALALKENGYKVGLLDADIDCPNVPQIANLPLNNNIEIVNNMLIPYDWDGIDVISLAWTMPETTPILFDDTQKQEIIEQIVALTKWRNNLDYLIIDCPAGTGGVLFAVLHEDITGGIIVTTPHAAAVSDAKRAKDMLKEYKVPLIGIINNMAFNLVKCQNCGSENFIKMAKDEKDSWEESDVIVDLPYKEEIITSNRIENFDAIILEILRRIPNLKKIKHYESRKQKLERAMTKFALKASSKV